MAALKSSGTSQAASNRNTNRDLRL